MISGEDGILRKTVEAKENTEIISEKESVNLAVMDIQTLRPEETQINEETVLKVFKSQFGNNQELTISNFDNRKFFTKHKKYKKKLLHRKFAKNI